MAINDFQRLVTRDGTTGKVSVNALDGVIVVVDEEHRTGATVDTLIGFVHDRCFCYPRSETLARDDAEFDEVFWARGPDPRTAADLFASSGILVLSELDEETAFSIHTALAVCRRALHLSAVGVWTVADGRRERLTIALNSEDLD